MESITLKNAELLIEVEQYIVDFFIKNISDKFVYHDLSHTQNVVEGVLEIGELFDLSEHELELLQIAAWFHDTGYAQEPKDHEMRSAAKAMKYLKGKGFSEEDLTKINNCILATKLPQEPKNLLEEIICDADLSHLGKKNYWDRCGKVRQEIAGVLDKVMTDQEWVDFELEFMENHSYFTPVAQELYTKRKKKHIRQLLKQKLRLYPLDTSSEAYSAGTKQRKQAKKKKPKLKKKKKKYGELEIKDLRLGRGVETMYRTTYRTHVNLSSIADNKANIMLSINAIILSITVSTLLPRFDDNPKIILPTVVLVIVCLASVVFATLSTRPKITEGKFTREDIEKKRSNLLFFGNFYNMDLKDFHWGMLEMIKDQDFLYNSMTRDLYWLGKVLAKKYRYLSICYNVFMYGLIISTLCFAAAFLWGPSPS